MFDDIGLSMNTLKSEYLFLNHMAVLHVNLLSPSDMDLFLVPRINLKLFMEKLLQSVVLLVWAVMLNCMIFFCDHVILSSSGL